MNALRTAIVALSGICLGLGLVTLNYAEGLSYFSTEPRACANCHIMNTAFDSWQKASHHGVAVCVDCHLPHDFLGKYIAKAENGWNHSAAFTLQNFPEPIRITAKNSRILQDNCVNCHSQLIDDVLHSGAHGDRGGDSPDSELRCVHCHRTVGHGERASLGGPLRDEE